MTFNDLIAHFGSHKEIARAIGIQPPSVYPWEAKGVPEKRQLEFQRITSGKIKADPEIVRKYRALLGRAA